jgi:hypothetical protein
MWELEPEHCCATCEQAEEERRYGNIEYSCALQLDALEPDLALAAYVDPDARCNCYECDENKFFARHGWHFAEPRAAAFFAPERGLPLAGLLEAADARTRLDP